MKTFKQFINEEAPAMSVGGGMQTLGSAQGTPIAGVDKLLTPDILRRNPPVMFGGKRVFKVSSDAYHRAVQGKKKYKHYKSYIKDPLVTQEIREYVKSNRNAPVIVQDEKTGAMVYLRHGKEGMR
jgi:hypothetical protein